MKRGLEQLEEVPGGYLETAAALVELAKTVRAQSTRKGCPVVELVEVHLDKYLGCEHPGNLGSNRLPLRLM